MELIIDSIPLRKGLKILKPASGIKNTLPILDNVLINVFEEGISFRLTNLEIDILYTIHLKTNIVTTFLINYKDFSKIVELSEGNVVIEIDKNTATITNNFSEYILPAITDVSEYPIQMRTEGMVEQIKFDNMDTLYPLLLNSSRFVGTDEMRPVMMQVLLSFTKNKLDIVATDAHKLINYSIDTEFDIECDIMLNPKVIQLLKDYSNLEINYHQNTTAYITNNNNYSIDIRFRNVNGKFPNWRIVLPKSNKFDVTVNVALLKQALKNVMVMSNVNNTIEINIGKTLKIESENTDYGKKSKAEIDCTHNINEPFKIGLNSVFFDLLIGLIQEDEVILLLNEENKPIFIREDNLFVLLMPVMLST